MCCLLTPLNRDSPEHMPARVLSTDEKNKLGAKIIKAEMMGNMVRLRRVTSVFLGITFFVLFYFGATLTGAQGLLLFLNSEIASDRLGDHMGCGELNPGLS